MDDSVRSETTPALRADLLAAVSEIRREAAKAAAVHAALDAMAVFVALRLATQLLSVGDGAAPLAVVPTPEAVAGPLRAVGVALPDPIGISAGSLVVTATAVSWLVVDAALRYERLGVERFEAHNPAVAEALRTARDAAERDVETPVARALYRTVLRRLTETSSRAFVDRRQLVGVTVVLVCCSAGLVGVAGAGVAPLDGGGDAEAIAGTGGGGAGVSGTGAGGPGAGGAAGTNGGADLLGTEGAVERGSENRSLRLAGDGDPSGDGTYGGGSVAAGSADVDPSRAAFSDEERPEAADLVRAYTERIRSEDPDE